MAKNKNKTKKYSKQNGRNRISFGFVKEALTLMGGLAGSILAIYGLVKTFKDDADGFSWLILVGIVIWVIILWRLFQIRKTTAYSLFIISMLLGVVGWVGWLSYNQTQEEKVIVLVAQFDGPEDKYHLRDEILKQIKTTAKGFKDIQIIPLEDVITEALGSQYAKNIGEKSQADLVIWGWYTDTAKSNLNLYIENLAPNEIKNNFSGTSFYQQDVALVDFESLRVQKQLGANLSNLVIFLAGVFQYETKNFATALERFESIREDDTTLLIDRQNFTWLKGNCHFALKHYDIAVSEFSKIIELEPDFVEAYNNRGAAYVILGQTELALRDFALAIRLKSDFPDIYINRGGAYTLLNQYDLANNDFNQAILLDPNRSMPYVGRGTIYLLLEQYDNAINDFDHAISLQSDIHDVSISTAYNNRGYAYYFLGEYKRAISDFDRAIQLEPDFAGTHINRGTVYEEIGQTNKALKDFNEAVVLEPDSIETYRGRARIYFVQELYDKSIEDYNRVIQLDPNDSISYNNRGLSYANLGNYDNAIQDFDKAIELDPNSAYIYYNRANVYQQLGKIAEAEADFKKYEELTGERP